MKLEQLKQLVKLVQLHPDATKADATDLLREIGLDPQAMYQELEMSSRFVDTHLDVNQPSDQVQLHSHTFYEILNIRRGKGVQYLVGTGRYRLQRGDVIIVAPGVAHRPLLTDSVQEPYRRDVLWLSQEFVDGMQAMFPSAVLALRTTALVRTAGTPWEEILRERFRAGIREAERRADGWEVMVLGNTVQLLTLLGRAVADRGGGPQYVEKPELLEEVLAWMERHLGEKITLAAAAQRFFVSERKISSTFREKMGVSFHQVLLQRRLIWAKNLIHEGVGLERISEQVGFADYSSFYRAFRQAFGISPRQYRKMQEAVETAGRGFPVLEG